MATTTPNFGWDVPQSTDLVKDGATAIAALGNDIDTSLVDLKGGTTGQVLSKASNTDMDFTWVAQDDSNAIQNALLTTTGDTIYASSASTPARLGIGTTGQVLTVSGGVPSWATPSTGSMTLIQSITASNQANVEFTSIPNTYQHLQLIIRNIRGVTDNTTARMRFNSDTTANRHQNYRFSAVDGSAQSFGQTEVDIADLIDNTATTGQIIITVFDYASTTTWKQAMVNAMTVNATTTTSFTPWRTFSYYNQTSAISSLIFFMQSGNIQAGVFSLYGVK